MSSSSFRYPAPRRTVDDDRPEPRPIGASATPSREGEACAVVDNARSNRRAGRYRSRVWLRVARRASVSVRWHSTTPTPATPAIAERVSTVAGVPPRGDGVATRARRRRRRGGRGWSTRCAPPAPRRPGNVTARATSVVASATGNPAKRIRTRRVEDRRPRRDSASDRGRVRDDGDRPVAERPRDRDADRARALARRDRQATRRPARRPPLGGLHARVSP